MSEEGSFGLSLVERVFGLLLILIGGIATYYTLTSAEALFNFYGFFVLLSVIPLVLGLFLLIAKIE